MEIKLGKENNIELDISKNSSMLLIGKCGTGKTKTIKDILKQVMDSGEKINIIYLDQHQHDFEEVKGICGNLLNKTNELSEYEFEDLLIALQEQTDARNEIITSLNLHSIEELRGRLVTTYYIDGVEYMPDDIVQINHGGSQEFVLAKNYNVYYGYNDDVFLANGESTNKYEPKRTIICVDEFYLKGMSEEINDMLNEIILNVIRFGRTSLQSIICTTQSFDRTPKFKKLAKLFDTKFFFHNGLDNDVDFKILFDESYDKFKLYRRGDVTTQISDKITEFKEF
jgi:ABC-type multidrug transport system ATPase subunit